MGVAPSAAGDSGNGKDDRNQSQVAATTGGFERQTTPLPLLHREIEGQNSASSARARFSSMGRSASLRYIGEQQSSMRPGTEKTPKDEALIIASLTANPNLAKLVRLNDEQIKNLAATAWKEVVVPGRSIMLEGSLNNAVFYIVQSGQFEVSSSFDFNEVTFDGMSFLSRPEAVFKVDVQTGKNLEWSRGQSPGGEAEKTVRKVGGNGKLSFGDSSMLYGTPRWMTAIALEQSTVWVISQANFKLVQAQAARGTLSFQKTEADDSLMARTLRANANLQALAPLSGRHISQLSDVAWKETMAKGQVLMREGDLNIDAFYIVAEGSVKVESSEPFELGEQDGASFIKLTEPEDGGFVRSISSGLCSETSFTCGKGLCIGEISMLYCAPRFTTVTALETSVVFAIDRSSFQMVQMKAAEEEMKERVKYLETLSVMKTFGKEDKSKVAGAMDMMRFTAGQTLTTEGVANSNFYILTDGTFSVSSQQEPLEAGKGIVHYFGEKFNQNAVADETVVVKSATASALVLQQETFAKVWERLIDAAPSPGFVRYATSVTKISTAEEGFCVKKLTPLKLIGRTNLGPVDLVVHKEDLYVLKTMNKGLIYQRGLRKSVARERRLWMDVISPFIVRCVAAFNEPQELKLLLEPALGGDLLSVYSKHGLFGSEKHARFHVAGVVLALVHLHKRRIVYRNIKPENILISHLGLPQLTDFSLAKLVVGHTFTSCGVPNYMAPEILTGVGHTRAVDWWSLGVLLFELLAGSTPFQSGHPMNIYSKIMRGIARVIFPMQIQETAESLITDMLQADPRDRLGMRQGGVTELKSHVWFAGFDWEAMRRTALDAPWVPTFTSDPAGWRDLPTKDLNDCLSDFSVDASFLPQPVEYEDDFSGWDDEFEASSSPDKSEQTQRLGSKSLF